MKIRPDILAKRAVYQYRRRDILAYASLRLYFRNRCALRNRWASVVAQELVLNQSQPSLNHVRHFKQIGQNGHPEFRDLFLPGPNEIVAETALLARCADAPKVFQPPTGAYSYKLSTGAETQGVFKFYFPDFLNRHRAIARACRQETDAVVLYTDIKNFYPSVSISLAQKVWSAACKKGNLSRDTLRLGMKLLENQAQATDSDGASLLVGPMFSHLIGNLVLRNIDLEMGSAAPGQYFRYVDDFVLVAPHGKVTELEETLVGMLEERGLELHSQKRMEVRAANWLEFEKSFEEDRSGVSWRTFIGKLKQLMLIRPECRKEMEDRFRDVEIRIRPIDYSEVLQETEFLARIRMLMRHSWFRLQMRSLNPERIVVEGLQLRSSYLRELDKILARFQESDPFGKRMCTPRLRFLLSRLGYLATSVGLRSIATKIEDIQELAIYAASFRAIVNRDVSDLLRFGPQAAQSVIQPLRMDFGPVQCSVSSTDKEVSQAYAIFLLNGVSLSGTIELPETHMLKFCQGGSDVAKLFISSDIYFRELACLHGIDEPNVLTRILETAFDYDEEMVFDMMDYMYMSY